MKFFEKLNKFFSLGLKGKCEETILNRIIFINVLSFSAVLMLVAFSAIAFYLGDSLRGGATLSAAFIIASGFYFIYKTLRIQILAILNTVLIVALILYVILFETNEDSALFWLLIIPAVSSSIWGVRYGSLLSVFVLVASVALLSMPDTFFITNDYSFLFLARFSGAYTGLILVSCTLENFRISNLRQLEMQLIEAKNEVKEKENFISRLSHQIRTPLNNIMLIGNMANESNLTSEQKDLMETIVASAQNLLNAVEDIAESSVKGKEKEEKVGFNLFSTVNNTIKLFASQGHANIEFNFAITKHMKNTQLIGEPVKLRQILLNLIETIIKNKGAEKLTLGIEVETTYENQEYADAKFHISTDKPVSLPFGITDINEPRRAFPASDFSAFTNISELAIAHKLITQSGGNLELSFTPEKNLVFEFSLPFSKSFREKKTPSTESVKTDKSPAPASDIKLDEASILLVEDNSINQKILMLSLKKAVGKVDLANNGKEALEMFGKSKYDIILMDIQMPIMDGIVATKKIREVESSINAHTPVIAITANALHGDRETCLAAGMDDYISKPFNADELLFKMKKLLERC